jgi:hypothetical protein
MKRFAKPLAAVLGLTAACAACCAIPIALPAILAIAGVTSASLGASSVAVAIGAAAVSLFGVAWWQRAKRKAAAANKACSCDTSCDVKSLP